MKKIFKKLLTVMFVMMMFVSMTSHNVLAYDGSNDQGEQGQATLTIEGLQKGDKVRVWQIITIDFDSESNTLSYEFTKAAKNYFDSKDTSINDFMALSGESGINKLNELLAGLPQNIKDNKVSVKTEGKWFKPLSLSSNIDTTNGSDMNGDGVITVGNQGVVVLKNLKAGGYFVEPCESDVVYKPMFVSIVPSVVENPNGANYYEYQNRTYTAKYSTTVLNKYVKAHGAGVWSDSTEVSYNAVDNNENYSTVDFRTAIHVPAYVYGTNNILKLVETLPLGLTIVGDVKILSSDSEDGVGTAITNYPSSAVVVSTNKDTITVDFGGDNYSSLTPSSWLILEYTANVGRIDIASKDENDNRVANTAKSEFKYSAYPYLAGNTGVEKTLTKTVNIYTGAIKINKYEAGNESKKLADATFALYRQDSKGTSSLTVNGNSVNVTKIALEKSINTNNEGVATVEGLTPNATYYLVETKAPSGYTLDSAPIQVYFTIDTLNDNGYKVLKIENSKATLTLPTTGATGMVAFTVCGLAVMAAAIVILVKTRESH